MSLIIKHNKYSPLGLCDELRYPELIFRQIRLIEMLKKGKLDA